MNQQSIRDEIFSRDVKQVIEKLLYLEDICLPNGEMEI